MRTLKIVFMGTPEFAVPSLLKLAESPHSVISVVTAPDKPSGRGLRMLATPVKRAALDLGIPVMTPTKLKAPSFVASLHSMEPDLIMVVAFRILPAEVFTISPLGAINLHTSLLPKYRGPAPINWAIINGEKETGVTTFFINEGVDTGDMILQQRVEIGEDETAGELHDRLMNIGAELLLESANLVARGEAMPIPQPDETPSGAPKLSCEDGIIDWSQPSQRLRNFIRGMTPYPGAYTFLKGKRLKVSRIEISGYRPADLPGEVTAVSPKDGIYVSTGDGVVKVTCLQPEGRRMMTGAEFARGHSISPGEVLEGEKTYRH